MSISNQTEACYLRLNSVGDILICRGDFCLSKIGEEDVGDISSCGTTVLELENNSSNEGVNNPSYITSPIIIFVIIIILGSVLCIIITMMKRSKNRNNADNYFQLSGRRDQSSFRQIATTEKYVDNAIRNTIQDCYRTTNPAYEKQLFIVESNVRGNYVSFRTVYK